MSLGRFVVERGASQPGIKTMAKATNRTEPTAIEAARLDYFVAKGVEAALSRCRCLKG